MSARAGGRAPSPTAARSPSIITAITSGATAGITSTATPARCSRATLPLLRRDLQIVEVQLGLPIIEGEVAVPAALERAPVVEREERLAVDLPLDVAALARDAPVVLLAFDDVHVHARLAIGAVLVHARDRRDLVVPAAEDEDVAGGGVRRRGGEALAVAPDLDLEVAGVGIRPAVELDDRVLRDRFFEPRGVVVGAVDRELAVLDAPRATGDVPVVAERGAIEVVARWAGGWNLFDLTASDGDQSDGEHERAHRPLLPR